MKGLHNIFKKVAGGAKDVFKKASDVGEDVFRKGQSVVNTIKEQGPGIAEQISKQAGEAQGVLSRVGKIAGKIGASPITAGIPLIGGGLAAGATAISGASNLAARGAGQISQASNLANYRKGGVNKQLENLGDLQRRGREINETNKEIGRIFV